MDCYSSSWEMLFWVLEVPLLDRKGSESGKYSEGQSAREEVGAASAGYLGPATALSGPQFITAQGDVAPGEGLAVTSC